MPVNESEAVLSKLAEQTFLRLWSYPNPFRSVGKEMVDLLVVFGDDVVLFSDKASALPRDIGDIVWRRWYKRAITQSIKQLKGAVRTLNSGGPSIFVDTQASRALPIALPDIRSRRLHLLAVTRTESADDHTSEKVGPSYIFDNKVENGQSMRAIGLVKVDEHPVHVLDASALASILSELDTARDFIAYLAYRKTVITSGQHVRFAELDLLAAFALSRRLPAGSSKIWESLARRKQIQIRPQLWSAYENSNVRLRSRNANRISYAIDNFIEHFHGEFVANRTLYSPRPEFSAHEAALRLLASESRFGRRIISHELHDILNESDQSTFWAATIASRDIPGVRYVWLTYPKPPSGVPLEQVEKFLSHYLQKHAVVARSVFPADVIIAIAVPNPGAGIRSYMIAVLDGTIWGPAEEKRATYLKTEEKIFAGLDAFQREHLL